MTDLRKAAEMALAKLDHLWEIAVDERMNTDVLPEIKALRQALAQPEQDASSWRVRVNETGWCEVIEYGPAPDDQKITPIYTTPLKREWEELNVNEVREVIYENITNPSPELLQELYGLVASVDLWLQEKNHG